MTQFVFANNSKSTLAAPVAPSATSITLFTGQGALFPNPSSSQIFAVSLLDQATATQREIMYCTNRAGDVLTVVRAQEGTSALTWVIGDFVNGFITAGIAASFTQDNGGPTASRPVPPNLYQEYFDTDLGYIITCKQVSSPIWVNAAGVAV